VQTKAEVDRTTLLHKGSSTSHSSRQRRVTSRAAENLYWLGRYTERSENTVRLARLCLEALTGEDPTSRSLWTWLQQLAQCHGLIPQGVPITALDDKTAPSLSQSARRRVFERTLIAGLDTAPHTTSVGYNLRALQQAASSLRERLSPEHWSAIVRCVTQFNTDCAHLGKHQEFSAVQALQALDTASATLAAITGAQTDRMTRDSGWQLLSIGRHVERLNFLASALDLAVNVGALDPQPCDDALWDDNSSHYVALLRLFDSTITFQAQHQQSRDIEPLLALLVRDTDNPRSLAWVARTLRNRLSKLADTPMGEPDPLARLVPDVSHTPIHALCQRHANGHLQGLHDLLSQCMQAAWQVSDGISARYFSHTDHGDSVGA
jgi:uncharacterized alpha-E superfamily protein